MEFITMLVEIFPTVGFPIICCGALAWFIYKFYQDSQKQNQENMIAVQAKCQEREDKLYSFMEKQQVINADFAEIIAKYDIKLEEIRDDIVTIKTDIGVLTNKK